MIEIDEIEAVSGKWYVYDGQGGMYTPHDAEQIALDLIRWADRVRRRNQGGMD